MFGNKEVLRRLDKVEEHFEKCDARDSKFMVFEAELTAQLKDISTFFKDYTKREEEFMKEHSRREEEAARTNNEILLNIKEDIHGIKSELASQPKDVALLLIQQDEKIREHCNDTFATKPDLDKGLNGIRRQAKMIWYAVAVAVACFAYLIDKISPMLAIK